MFAFGQNNVNYTISSANSDLSWTKGKKLYYERKSSSKLKEVKVGQVAMEKLSLK
ncbi:MAG: hypothetical protein ACR5KX_04450 [Wolbachia sp.]